MQKLNERQCSWVHVYTCGTPNSPLDITLIVNGAWKDIGKKFGVGLVVYSGLVRLDSIVQPVIAENAFITKLFAIEHDEDHTKGKGGQQCTYSVEIIQAFQGRPAVPAHTRALFWEL